MELVPLGVGALPADFAEPYMHYFRFDDSLDDALVACLGGLINWLRVAAGISKAEAYALSSMAVSFRVTQYAHQTSSAYTSTPPKTVHGLVPKSVFPQSLQDRIQSFLRPGRVSPALACRRPTGSTSSRSSPGRLGRHPP